MSSKGAGEGYPLEKILSQDRRARSDFSKSQISEWRSLEDLAHLLDPPGKDKFVTIREVRFHSIGKGDLGGAVRGGVVQSNLPDQRSSEVSAVEASRWGETAYLASGSKRAMVTRIS